MTCWLCERPGPPRTGDVAARLAALGWRHVREDEWICAECTAFEDRAPSSTLECPAPIGSTALRRSR